MLCLLWPMSGAQQLTKTSMMNSSFSSGGDYLIRVCKIVKLMMCFDCLQFIYSNLNRFLILAGFGNLTGEIDIWDVKTKKKVGNCKSSSAYTC